MRYGFIKAAVGTPELLVADCTYNAGKIIEMILEAEKKGVKILVLPSLCITGCTCGDLFLQDVLIRSAEQNLKRIAASTKGMDILAAVGVPVEADGKLFQTAAVICNGEILAFVPKMKQDDRTGLDEARYFEEGSKAPDMVLFDQKYIPMGSRILFACREVRHMTAAVEIAGDLWSAQPPGSFHAAAGALILLNCSADYELAGRDSFRKEMIKSQSARLVSAYLYADAGEGESTTDYVFAGQNRIAENGVILAESEKYKSALSVSEIDLEKLYHERRRIRFDDTAEGYRTIWYSMPSFLQKAAEALPLTMLTRHYSRLPFVPENKEEQEARCGEVFMILAAGLKKRLLQTGMKQVVLGISGGLDSTLALLTTIKAFQLSALDLPGITAVTMPCFGTTGRTYQNAVRLILETGITSREVNICAAVSRHLEDIGQDPDCHDTTYENAQARERMQVLMDIANQIGGFVVGTGDLSELALGFTTYNGDHMSMYGVNASIPKTLVRYLIRYEAEHTEHEPLKQVLYDILDTPISPELLPPKEGEILQITENIIGPYELHDFFLYYMLRFGYAPDKIAYLAQYAFFGKYEKETIIKWLRLFYRRFFAQQYKRSCLPDGPAAGICAVSPRGSFKMPSDASVEEWMRNIENIKESE